MTRTKGHGTGGTPSTAPGTEWWGKRPLAGHPKGGRRLRWWKRRLHKIERHRAHDDIEQRLDSWGEL